MITKTQLISTLDQLPENLTVEEVIEHIIFVGKMQKGLADSEAGKLNTKEQAKAKLSKWLK
ncbi:hypothetical protein [uncultured Cytophaga sp.]|uniref:hypothetical protein n=1 Tax=uncultured Cytophaga sp. TaxID=160238 RepID=UPI002632D059|nr:hypothetical protein [uncultured Cytophaga sp.]